MSEQRPLLALDLDGTLVALQGNLTLRPGLPEFFDFAYQHFAQVVIYSLVSKPQAQAIVQHLVAQGQAPPRLAQEFTYVESENAYKDLNYVPLAPGQRVLLIDDNPGNVRPGQEPDFLPIARFRPYAGGFGAAPPDQELILIQDKISQWLSQVGLL